MSYQLPHICFHRVHKKRSASEAITSSLFRSNELCGVMAFGFGKRNASDNLLRSDINELLSIDSFQFVYLHK